jgi:hypothetical protein
MVDCEMCGEKEAGKILARFKVCQVGWVCYRCFSGRYQEPVKPKRIQPEPNEIGYT